MNDEGPNETTVIDYRVVLQSRKPLIQFQFSELLWGVLTVMEMEEEAGSFDSSVHCLLYMKSAALSMEPPEVVIGFARELGGGSITRSVQRCIWESCIVNAVSRFAMAKNIYLKRLIKKLISEIESSGGAVLEELYEQYCSYMIDFNDLDGSSYYNSRVLRRISFIFPGKSSDHRGRPKPRNLEVQLQCYVNMLEGDTGCSIWPSSLLLSEFILSYPEFFAGKRCFELGSGVGLAGICLSYVKASKVILSDGDLLTLANMKLNFELNNLTTGIGEFTHTSEHQNKVDCIHLPWESASDNDLRLLAPGVILGADIIYDPSCLAHLVRVLAAVLNHKLSAEPPVAYLASVIRSVDTFEGFLALAKRANLSVSDVTGDIRPMNLLPYMRSYQRSTVRMLKIRSES